MESPFDKPVNELKSIDPVLAASRAGGVWIKTGKGEGVLEVPVLTGTVRIGYPQMEIEADPPVDRFTLKLLTVMYLARTDGTMPSGEWIAYRDVPEGRFYEPVVKRSVEDPLINVFGFDRRSFDKAAISIGGLKEEAGDISYSFSLFPKLPYCFILWIGDDEFEPRSKLLIDSNCHHHLGAFELRMGAEEVYKMLEKRVRI